MPSILSSIHWSHARDIWCAYKITAPWLRLLLRPSAHQPTAVDAAAFARNDSLRVVIASSSIWPNLTSTSTQPPPSLEYRRSTRSVDMRMTLCKYLWVLLSSASSLIYLEYRQDVVDPSLLPTEEETHTLRRVADSIPMVAWTIVFVEFAERYSWYGTTGPMVNYIQRPLPPGSKAGNVINNPNGVAGALGRLVLSHVNFS